MSTRCMYYTKLNIKMNNLRAFLIEIVMPDSKVMEISVLYFIHLALSC